MFVSRPTILVKISVNKINESEGQELIFRLFLRSQVYLKLKRQNRARVKKHLLKKEDWMCPEIREFPSLTGLTFPSLLLSLHFLQYHQVKLCRLYHFQALYLNRHLLKKLRSKVLSKNNLLSFATC